MPQDYGAEFDGLATAPSKDYGSEFDGLLPSPPDTAGLIDERTAQKGPRGITGPRTKRERILDAQIDEQDQPSTAQTIARLTASPTQAKAGLKSSVAGILKAVNAPPILGWLWSKSAEQDAKDAAEMGEKIGGGKLGDIAQNFGATAINSAPALAAAPLGLPYMATIAGAQTFGSVVDEATKSYNEKGDPDGPNKARLAGALAGVVTAGLTRYVPGGSERLMQGLLKGTITRETGESIIKTILKESVLEFPEEALDQVSQGVIAKFSYQPERTWQQIGDESIEAGLSGSALAALTGSAGGALQKLSSRSKRSEKLRLTREIRDALIKFQQEQEQINPEPDQSQTDYGTGGEMPRNPAVWEQEYQQTKRLTRTSEPSQRGIGGGEMRSSTGPDFQGQPFEPTTESVEIGSKSVVVPQQTKTNEAPPQTPEIPEPAPSRVVEEKQTQGVSSNPEGVRPAIQTPAPAQSQVGQVEVVDLSTIKTAANLNKYKSKVDVLFDPAIAKGGKKQAKMVPVMVALNPNPRPGVADRLLLQDPKSGDAIWSAPVRDLVQSGVMTDLGGGRFSLDQDKLFRSQFLTKSKRRQYKAYKLPTEQPTRSTEPEAESVIAEATKLNGFLGAVLRLLNDQGVLTMTKIKSLAGARTGGAEYAGKDAKKLAKQVGEFVRRVLDAKMEDGRVNLDNLTNPQKRELLGLAQASEKLKSEQYFTPEEVQAIANYLATVTEVESVDAPREEVSLEEVSGSGFGGDEGGEVSSENPVGATWDPARTDSIIGLIEDKNPKLYQSFEADPENDRAWEAIEQELVKFLNGDKVGAEILAEAVRQKRMEGWIAGEPFRQESFEEHNWLTGVSAQGKDGIVSLLENRNIQLDPQVRRIGLALLKRISAKYLAGLTFSIDATGTAGGEFIPWLKTAKIAMDSTNPEIAAHEISHYLASFLTDKERSMVSNARANDLKIISEDKTNKPFIDWLMRNGGNVTSSAFDIQKFSNDLLSEAEESMSEWTPSMIREFQEAIDRSSDEDGFTSILMDRMGWDPEDAQSAATVRFVMRNKSRLKPGKTIDKSLFYKFYYLINDDEYFAHYMSQAGAKPSPELKTLMDKVGEIVKQIFTAIKAWLGDRDAYFDQLLRKFEKGEFDVNVQGGMLFERNNKNKPKSLPPISSLPALRRFTSVDQGTEEQQLVRTLTHEQNQPLVGHVLEQFNSLPRSVRANLPEVAARLAALVTVNRQGGASQTSTPLKHYAVLVNALAMQQETKELGNRIQSVLDEIQKQNKRGGKASLAEARAAQLEEMAQDAISRYKDFLLSEQRKAQNDGVAQGLGEAIKSLDSLRDSTESLKRAIDYIGNMVTLEQLNNPALTTQEVVDLFKAKVMQESGAATWQQAVLVPSNGKPGVNNEQLRIAVRILQENQKLVQDLITHKELSDPNFASLMKSGEPEIDKQIASLTYRQLRSFLKSYRSITSAKDKARQIYLKHRVRLKDLIEKLENLSDAELFMQEQIIESTQFKTALAEASIHGFMSADLVRDNSGSDVLKRTYYNPLNLEESVEVIDGTTKADYLRNIISFEKAATWFEDAQESDQLGPLDREMIKFELDRIYNQELDNALYDPATGKRVNYPFSIPSVISGLVGNSLTYAMNKIGGRAAVQAATTFQARSEARRRVSEVRRELEYTLQKSILDAARSHAMPISRWTKEVAEPVLASFNSIGSKQIKATDTTRYGHAVNGKDMESIRQMKMFSDAMIKAASDMELHTAKLHPIQIKEVLSGKEILRPQQGGTENILPRRFRQEFVQLLEGWSKIKNGRKAGDVLPQLIEYVQSGTAFEEMLLAHIYSTQRYPDYVGTTRFKNGYREIYRRIWSGAAPTSFNQVVDIVFGQQTGNDPATQLTKEEIAKEIIVQELDVMSNRVLDQNSKDRAADTPGQTVRIESADNFLTKPRGQMVAPDGGYQYSVVSDKDIRWMSSTVLEAHEQMARDGLSKVQRMLQDYINKWKNKVDAQKQTKAQQLSGEDWLNYREAKQMLNQVNLHLERTSPEAFKSFIDDQFGGISKRSWSIIVQSLLQSATVLKNNFLGMNLRQWQMDAQWRGDGIWMGMPRWLLKLPSMARNSIVYPIRDIPAYILNGMAYRKVLKKGVKVNSGGKESVGQEALRAIIYIPELAQAAAEQVGGALLKRAITQQRLNDLGAGGSYGIQNQLERYIRMHTFGGSLEHVDPTGKEKVFGSVTSLLGLFQETGFGLMLPKALAPRKLEQFLNFQAARYGDRLLEELTLNLKEAIQSRVEAGIEDAPITDAELLGDPKADKGSAIYMRRMFGNAGLNLDALMDKLRNNSNRDLLEPAQWNSFILEVLKELNMPSADNRIQFKSGFGKLMSTLMGYGFWYNERLADSMAHDSHKKFDPAAVYRGLFFLGVIVSMGVFVGTPLQRWIKRLLYDEEDQTGHFSEDNTGWRNAAVLWEQTAPFWPVTGSIMSQLYDAKSGNNKLFNFLPVTIGQQLLQSGNEIAQTGNAFYPTLKLMRLWFPNTKIVVNRLPEMEGMVDVSNAARSLRSTADGVIEVRSQKGGGVIKYSPISTETQMAVNELARDRPDYEMINQYRGNAVKALMRRGATRADAERRFDLGVLARFPENTVFGRPLTVGEKNQVLGRMNPGQSENLYRVETAFDTYATRYGLRAPSQQRKARQSAGLSRGNPRLARLASRRRSRLTRNRSLTRRRTRRLVRA